MPALAVAGALRTRGASVYFIGGDRAERELVPAAGYELERIAVRGIDRRNPLKASLALAACESRNGCGTSDPARAIDDRGRSVAVATWRARSALLRSRSAYRSCSVKPTATSGSRTARWRRSRAGSASLFRSPDATDRATS